MTIDKLVVRPTILHSLYGLFDYFKEFGKLQYRVLVFMSILPV